MIKREGYQANFPGDHKTIPFPGIGPEHQDDILRKDEFRENMIVDYNH